MARYTPSDRAAEFESITRELSAMQEERAGRENKPCCAKCMRGTKALPGGCSGRCPNRCHEKGKY